MKIVEIINELNSRAGAEVFFFNLCTAISKSANQLYVIVLFDDIDKSFKELATLDNVRFFSLHKKRGLDLAAAKRLRDLIVQIQPDIIHSHLDVTLTYFFAFGFKKRSWTLVHTVHNIAEKEASKLLRYIRNVFTKKRQLYFVGISDIISQTILDYYHDPIVATIYNGIPLKDSLPPMKIIYDFVCVARFSYQKNHFLLFNAFNTFWKKHKRATLLCIGDGELKEDLKNYLHTLDCYNSVTIHDSVDNVYPFLCSSRTFVLSSLYEGNPISILEALDVGLPIVAPRVGGIPDIVEDNENGILYAPNDLLGLVQALEQCYENNEFLLKTKEHNHKKVERFDINNVANDYLLFFAELKRGG